MYIHSEYIFCTFEGKRFVRSRKKTATNGDTSRKYILDGGGITISILLYLIIVQLYHCKRSKSAKNRTIKLKACQRMYTSEKRP